MKDTELIEALRNYARSYSNGNPYTFNPGVALMVANRLEQLTIKTEFNIGDRVWIPDCVYDEWFVRNKEGDIINSVRIYHNIDGNELKMYTLKNDGYFQEYSPKICFNSYEECKQWCDKENKG